MRVEASGLADDALAGAIDAAYARIEEVEQALSFHRPDSELQTLHRSAMHGAQRVGTDLWNVLVASRDFWTRSGGVFDPAVAAALVRDGLLPEPASLVAPDANTDFGVVELLADQHVRLRQAVWLDFGGIAKGYAVDQALAVLRAAGAGSACVNAGGDLACFGKEQTIALRDPRAPTGLARVVRLRDAACATSGHYFQPRALRDGRDRSAQCRRGSVSVIAASCMNADALTKIVWAARPAAAALLDQCAARVVELATDDGVAVEPVPADTL
ncbi:FAD:protein FMN transferase [Solimonas terrae]|uniref:FAD:protein FMN transferase n=1 Tax=Solimonas terrae TaxID=1396819 RepID=A0A6M2BPW1_9GAMM|nr:FAD:protein FMN transferase [Solimonas terrae]